MRRLVFEFYPELEIYKMVKKGRKGRLRAKGMSVENKSYTSQKILVAPTKDSLRMYLFARQAKAKLSRNRSSSSKPGTPSTSATINTKTNVSIIKKFSGLKSFRLGKPVRIKILPVLVFNNTILCQNKILNKKEYFEIMNEVLNSV
jgi:hypothetical protein